MVVRRAQRRLDHDRRGATVTATNGTLVGLASTDGGAVTFTLAGADNDLLQVQMITEPFLFAAAWPAYFGVKFSLVDFDQTDFFAGLTITDADLDGGVSDGLYFRTVDRRHAVAGAGEEQRRRPRRSSCTGADATVYIAEFYYDGAGYVHAYLERRADRLDGDEQRQLAERRKPGAGASVQRPARGMRTMR